MMMKKWMVMAGIACSCAAQAAEKPALPDGAYGFDWYGNTPCRKMDKETLRRFKSCESGGSGFGDGVLPLLTCRHGKNDEWVIYASKAQCRDERETMEANAP
ncbi:hypothetical protein CXB49_08320 [Chromobacterium sp. ATCC 53434]|uniref:hypothetical protein n=1 Tax=Chromobacterium sp. (strain ATCC 53434 / SC 14030) TaxID=2059672 RepID=UPI000C7639AD|nr:hypothetical protein [Chromobacterium sp. ATCC 53434]AUH50809.1 hypothetical protein CXB49_08320 [Chromobacterium sp. ATCC 53434]